MPGGICHGGQQSGHGAGAVTRKAQRASQASIDGILQKCSMAFGSACWRPSCLFCLTVWEVAAATDLCRHATSCCDEQQKIPRAVSTQRLSREGATIRNYQACNGKSHRHDLHASGQICAYLVLAAEIVMQCTRRGSIALQRLLKLIGCCCKLLTYWQRFQAVQIHPVQASSTVLLW